MDKYKLYNLESVLKRKNPHLIFNEYVDLFHSNIKIFPVKIIKENEEYYRARVGYQSIKGAIHDFDSDIKIPYYGESIGAAPPLISKGGRFNREGTSFLYLGTNVDTCIAELRSEVNQTCSVAKFICKEESKYIDLTADSDSEAFKILKKIMLEPIHSDIKHRYLITQFIAEVFREIGFDGIYFESTLSEGENIVCYYPSHFYYDKFSEKMYRTIKVDYQIEEIEDSYKNYGEYRKGLSSYNASEEEEKEKIIDYIDDKIQFKYDNIIKEYVDLAEKSLVHDEKLQIYDKMVDQFKSDMITSRKVFSIRGNYYRDSDMFECALKDYYDSRRYCSGFISDEKLVEYIFDNIKLNSQYCDGDTTMMKKNIEVFVQKSKKNFELRRDSLIASLKEH